MSTTKQQFNIYLPADLVKRVERGALDADASLSHYVERALRRYLETELSGDELAAADRKERP